MASVTSIAAELRGPIGASIPQIIDLLNDTKGYVRASAAEALSKLSEQGMQHIWAGVASLTSITNDHSSVSRRDNDVRRTCSMARYPLGCIPSKGQIFAS
jgi:HEAT repeat protein